MTNQIVQSDDFQTWPVVFKVYPYPIFSKILSDIILVEASVWRRSLDHAIIVWALKNIKPFFLLYFYLKKSRFKDLKPKIQKSSCNPQ